MKDFEQMALNVIQSAFNDGKQISVNDFDDWGAVIDELNKQAVLPIGYDVLSKIENLDMTIKRQCVDGLSRQYQSWYIMLAQQDQLIQLLKENGHAYVIMKGASNAVLYPEPQLRSIGDIDFLVKWEEYDDVCALLLDNGYYLFGEIDHNKHHIDFIKDDIVFEMHKRPAGTKQHYSTENQKLIDYFRAGLDQVSIAKIDGYLFCVFDPVRQGLMLLLHTAGHMQEGMGVRHLLDWGIYADKYLSDTFWNDLFFEKVRYIKLDNLAKVMTRICNIEFGLCKDSKWYADADKDTCDELLEYMIIQGNFGEKARYSDRGIKLITESIGTGGFFRRLDRSASYSMPIIVKYPLLRPVGWTYQIGRYFYKGISSGNSIRQREDEIKKGLRRKALFEKMGIYNWNDS